MCVWFFSRSLACLLATTMTTTTTPSPRINRHGKNKHMCDTGLIGGTAGTSRPSIYPICLSMPTYAANSIAGLGLRLMSLGYLGPQLEVAGRRWAGPAGPVYPTLWLHSHQPPTSNLSSKVNADAANIKALNLQQSSGTASIVQIDGLPRASLRRPLHFHSLRASARRHSQPPA